MTDFKSLGLAEPLLKALAASGYEQPTPIQTQAIPIALSGKDLIGLAQTGTGKTAAFALPILQRMAENRRHAGPKACRALILAPTRELAAQIAESFRKHGRFLGFSTAVVFGGVSVVKQKEALFRGVDVLVATPGRLLDLVNQRAARLDAVEFLVLDEADHMLDIGFIHALKRIADLVPDQRQSLFFSATMPPAIAELAQRFLTNPERIAVAPPASTAERVEQAVIHVEHAAKGNLLAALLDDPALSRAIVFTRTKHGADKVVKRLQVEGHEAEAIHGNKSQGQRERALAAFKAGRARVLVATEIAARGIDVDDVSHVINYDLPNVPEQYVHRIGRTARAGATGRAISFCAPDERSYLKDIEKLTKQPVPALVHPLGLRPPAPGEPTPPPPKPQGRGARAPQGQRPQGQRPQAQRPNAQRPNGPRPPAQRDRPERDRPERGERVERPVRAAAGEPASESGMRRTRKGHEIWSNDDRPPPPRGDRRRPTGRG